MRNRQPTVVISLSEKLIPLVYHAVCELSGPGKEQNVFDFGEFTNNGRLLPSSSSHRWNDLEDFLVAEKQRRGCARLIGVLDEPTEKNWFSNAVAGKDVAWVTLNDWEFYSDVSASKGLAYQLIQNHLLMLVARTPQDGEWLFSEVIHINETRGCISDMCVHKPDINLGIHSGDICPDCRRVLVQKLGEATLASMLRMLQSVKHSAEKQTRPERTIRPPWLSQLEDAAVRSAAISAKRWTLNAPPATELHPDLCCDDQESPEKPGEVSLSLSAGVRPSIGLEDFANVVTQLSQDVERSYPFPIAYCFRSLRAEYRAQERWQALYELYRLITRYTVFVMLAERTELQSGQDDQLRRSIEKLKFGSDADWGKACAQLLLNLRQNAGRKTLFKSFQDSFDSTIIDLLAETSRNLVQTRNRLAEGHGFRGDRQTYQTIFEQHLPAIKQLLNFIRPLADYVLIRPVEIVNNVEGECLYHAKVLMGSDAQFVTSFLRSPTPPQTVCQLAIPNYEKPITLHPWMHLDRCDSCRREMVFLYDAIHGRAGGARKVVLREYPSNHEQQRPELCQHVDRALDL